MCAAAVPAMRAQRWGRVLAFTSIGVRQPIGGLILSNVARSGLTAAGVLGQAGDFGRIAAVLCSESARVLTGTAIPVDGGAVTGLQ